MKSNRIKKFLTLFSFLMFLNLTLAVCAIALEVETHKAINNYIADENSVIYGSYLHNYLKNNLGMQDGVKSIFNSKMAKEWIGEGGEVEDQGIRVKNHFHNPITNKGLGVGVSALTWATLPAGGQDLGPISSWNDVRDYYKKALTSADKAARENWFARTFQGIGQVMHLVKDMSVPAHVRDDKHIKLLGFGGDNYENWMDRPENRNAIANFQVISFASDTLYPLNIKNLFDTDRYLEGTDPTITTSSNSIGLSEYTNANFFSGDTINAANFPYPKTDNNKKITKPYTGKEATYNREYFLKDCNEIYCQTSTLKNYDGYLLSAVDLNDYWRMQNPNSSNPKRIIPVLDENVHYDYAQLLIPRAIGYSSQVLKYFFRGQLDVTLGDGNIKIKNNSADTISNGEFKLYYDNADGLRTLLTSATANTLAPNGQGEQTISFTPPPEGATSYMLVYQGQLGAEPNAVIGKYIPADSTFAVFTIGAPGKKSTVVVYDIKNKSVLHTARESTEAEYVSWLAKTKVDGSSSTMFNYNDIVNKDTPPYKLRPDLIDYSNADKAGQWDPIISNLYHADNAPNRIADYEAWYYPQSRYTHCIDIVPAYYTGFRTEVESNSLRKDYYEIWYSYPDDPTVYIYFGLWTGQSLEEIDDEFMGLFPSATDYYNMGGYYEVAWNSNVRFWGEYGQIGDTISLGGISRSTGSYALPGCNLYFIPEKDHCIYIIRGQKNNNGFAMATIIVFQKAHSYNTQVPIVDPLTGEPNEYLEDHVEYMGRQVYVQAAGDFFNGKEFYEKSPNPTLEAALKSAIGLFYTANGYTVNQFCKEMTFDIAMRK